MMAPKLFGTDGVRGQANISPMTPDVIMAVAMASSQVIGNDNLSHRPTVVIGKDTRLSGYMVESALTAGFVSSGMDVILLGPLPTPAVAMLTHSMRADMGVMISASHNPALDNGIKFFGSDGFKLTDGQQKEIEAIVGNKSFSYATPEKVGKARRLDDAAGRYIEFLKGSLSRGPHRRFDGLKIVVDAAHGAAYKVAPLILWEMGADVIAIGTQPDGLNINDNCGSLYVEKAKETLLENKADLAIILDGDADRIILLDHLGNLIDGDQILAILATSWKKKGVLLPSKIAATQMSNLGFEHYLKKIDIDLVRTPVGDRYVLEAMKHEQLKLGGESSGHIILGGYSTTGDGLMSALHVLDILVEKKASLHDISHMYTPYPQKLTNLKGIDKQILQNPKVLAQIEDIIKELGEHGRILIRPSGTEALLRVMVEAKDAQILEQTMEKCLNVLKNA